MGAAGIWTRFRGIDSVDYGYAVGKTGSEVLVIDANGNVVSGVQDAVVVAFSSSSAAQTNYVIAPVAGNVVAAYICSDTASIVGTYTVKAGSAGSTIASCTQTSGVIGLVTTMTLGTVTVTAGQSISILKATQGTASSSVVTLVIQRTS